MKIVLGLGNPGAGYTRTRHNLGFRVVDLLAERGRSQFRSDPDVGRIARIAEIDLRGEPVALAKPWTYMNRSGGPAVALLDRYKIGPGDLIVVYDDADLALGRVRIRGEGRAGGHNGIRSLLDSLRTESFPRVKLGVRGVGRDDAELADYVLDTFLDEEEPIVGPMVVRAADAVEALVERGLAAAMNDFNPPG